MNQTANNHRLSRWDRPRNTLVFFTDLAATLLCLAFRYRTGKLIERVGLALRPLFPPELAHRASLRLLGWTSWDPALFWWRGGTHPITEAESERYPRLRSVANAR